jgi:hypothetical protein
MKARALFLASLVACGAAATHPEQVSAPVVPSGTAAPPATVLAPAPVDPPWRDDERFRVRVEQDGAAVPIVDHQVKLARHAFTFVFELAGIDFFSVNASYKSHTLDLARANAPLSALDGVFGLGRAAAEELDPPHGMFVDDESFNSWGWKDDVHRCHAHETPPGEQYAVCKRVVETFRNGPAETPVEKSTATALYVVVMSTETSTADMTQKELQRDWLTIAF